MLANRQVFLGMGYPVSLLSVVVFNGTQKHPDRSRGVVALAVEMMSRSRGAPQHCPLSSHQMRLTVGAQSLSDNV